MEHRWSSRRAVAGPVVVTQPAHGRLSAALQDVSLGGAFVATADSALALNTAVTLAFQIINGDNVAYHRLPATVVRIAPNGAGLMYRDIGVDALRALRESLYGRAPRVFPSRPPPAASGPDIGQMG